MQMRHTIDFEFIGCYGDGPSPRIMGDMVASSADMTNEVRPDPVEACALEF